MRTKAQTRALLVIVCGAILLGILQGLPDVWDAMN